MCSGHQLACSVVSRLVVQSSAGCSVGEMSAQELGHAEGLDPLAAEDRLHQLVRGEPLLVLRVLDEGITSRWPVSRKVISLNPVLRIHDISGWIRILGSMPLTNGSGSWIRILLFSSLTFKMPAKNKFCKQFFLVITL